MPFNDFSASLVSAVCEVRRGMKCVPVTFSLCAGSRYAVVMGFVLEETGRAFFDH